MSVLWIFRVDGLGNHGDEYPFADTTLAHAFYPQNTLIAGDMHFNTLFPFSTIEPPSATSKHLDYVPFFFLILVINKQRHNILPMTGESLSFFKNYILINYITNYSYVLL